MKGAVVIGIGNPYRGDDGVGHAACAALMDLLPTTEVLLLDGEPTRLIDAWVDRPLALVIDAVRTGDEPGTVHRIEVGVDPIPGQRQGHSTHAAGLASAFELGQALDRRPKSLVVYGVEPADMTEGHGLSPSVVTALPELVNRVAQEVRALRV